MVRVYSSGCFVAGVLAAQILVNIDEGGNWVREHDDVLPAEEKLKPIVSASREAPRTAPQDEEAAEMITTLEERTEGGSTSTASEGTEEKKVSDAQEPREGLSALNVTRAQHCRHVGLVVTPVDMVELQKAIYPLYRHRFLQLHNTYSFVNFDFVFRDPYSIIFSSQH